MPASPALAVAAPLKKDTRAIISGLRYMPSSSCGYDYFHADGNGRLNAVGHRHHPRDGAGIDAVGKGLGADLAVLSALILWISHSGIGTSTSNSERLARSQRLAPLLARLPSSTFFFRIVPLLGERTVQHSSRQRTLAKSASACSNCVRRVAIFWPSATASLPRHSP